MAKADLTAQRLRELFHYDPETGLLSRLKKRGKGLVGPAGWDVKGHLAVQVDGYNQYVHRLAWLYVYGSWPKEQIDHINGDMTDNRIANLRDVPRSINQQNMRKASRNNASGYLGVSLYRKTGKYTATLCVQGKTRHLGYHASPEEAHHAYLEAKRQLHAGCTI